MPVNEASAEETPYGRYVTSDGWFVLNLADALAVRNDEKGGAMYPLEPQEPGFRDVGVRVRVLCPATRMRSTTRRACRKGSSCSPGEGTLIVEDEERPLRQWDYFYCP